ncbi:MAG TPA: hypothetical protein VGD58_01940 [Herpetosiphonaceae bacterium]
MSARTRPQRSIRGRIVALIVGTGLLGSTLIFTSVQASPYSPYQNGFTWIAEACAAEPETTRSNAECIAAKCFDLYATDPDEDAFKKCVDGAEDRFLGHRPKEPVPFPAPPTATPAPIEA